MLNQICCLALALIWLIFSSTSDDKNGMVVANIFIAASFIISEINKRSKQ